MGETRARTDHPGAANPARSHVGRRGTALRPRPTQSSTHAPGPAHPTGPAPSRLRPVPAQRRRRSALPLGVLRRFVLRGPQGPAPEAQKNPRQLRPDPGTRALGQPTGLRSRFVRGRGGRGESAAANRWRAGPERAAVNREPGPGRVGGRGSGIGGRVGSGWAPGLVGSVPGRGGVRSGSGPGSGAGSACGSSSPEPVFPVSCWFPRGGGMATGATRHRSGSQKGR